MPTAVVLVGHGSRRVQAQQEFGQVSDAVARRLAPLSLHRCFLEAAPPGVAETLHMAARDVERVVVVPLFLFSARHVLSDLPALLDSARQAHPGVRFALTPALGPHEAMVELASRRVDQALERTAWAEGDTRLLLIGRGAREPQALDEFNRLVRRLAARRRFEGVHTAYCSMASPDVPSALSRLSASAPAPVVLMPYLLFAGHLLEDIEKHASSAGCPTQLAPPLGLDDLLLDVIEERARAALR